MNSLERVMSVVQGETPDRLPVWMSRHSAKGFMENAEEMAGREIEFQNQYDWDMVRAAPAAAAQVLGWGNRFEGCNHLGVPKCTKYAVNDVSEWERIAKLDPSEGSLGEIAKACRLLADAYGGSKPNLVTAFSPLTLAQKLSGDEVLLDSILHRPQVLEQALERIADTVIDFIHHCLDAGGDSLYFSTQTANDDPFDEETYLRFEKPYALKVLRAVKPRLRFSIFHMHGDHIRIGNAGDFPVDILNWADRRTVPAVPLSAGRRYFSGTIMGGINGRTTLLGADVGDIENEIADACRQMENRPFILSPCCVIPVAGVPSRNLRTVRTLADQVMLR